MSVRRRIAAYEAMLGQKEFVEERFYFGDEEAKVEDRPGIQVVVGVVGGRDGGRTWRRAHQRLRDLHLQQFANPGDNVGLNINGLDQINMPRSGDVIAVFVIVY